MSICLNYNLKGNYDDTVHFQDKCAYFKALNTIVKYELALSLLNTHNKIKGLLEIFLRNNLKNLQRGDWSSGAPKS
ncbi:hypothetical protein ASG85_10520 [Paenibacillus sp. Soil724D2]|nr:hypothetical protein ASG85_10520 [Paenibacillus sp. Soil724D2]